MLCYPSPPSFLPVQTNGATFEKAENARQIGSECTRRGEGIAVTTESAGHTIAVSVSSSSFPSAGDNRLFLPLLPSKREGTLAGHSGERAGSTIVPSSEGKGRAALCSASAAVLLPRDSPAGDLPVRYISRTATTAADTRSLCHLPDS